MAYETRNGRVVKRGTLPDVAKPSIRLNRYTCQTCRGQIITVDRDEGVTPFALECRATKDCQGDMYSSFYRDVAGIPTYEWRKPPLAEYATMSAAMRDHVDRGGLNLYPIARAAAGKPEVLK